MTAAEELAQAARDYEANQQTPVPPAPVSAETEEN